MKKTENSFSQLYYASYGYGKWTHAQCEEFLESERKQRKVMLYIAGALAFITLITWIIDSFWFFLILSVFIPFYIIMALVLWGVDVSMKRDYFPPKKDYSPPNIQSCPHVIAPANEELQSLPPKYVAKKFCPECGERNEKTANYCKSCKNLFRR